VGFNLKLVNALQCERGVTLIESALVLPFVIGFVLVFADICYLGYYKITLQHTVNLAARAGVPGWDDSSIRTAVQPGSSSTYAQVVVPSGSAQEQEIVDKVYASLQDTAKRTGLVKAGQIAAAGSFDAVLPNTIEIEDRSPVGQWIKVSATRTVSNLTPIGNALMWISLGRTTIELEASGYARIENPPTKNS